MNLNSFNQVLFQKICSASNGNENIFFSPLSISTALSMLLLGSDGETKQQIEKALGVVTCETFFHNLKNQNKLLNTATYNLTIKLASSIFPDKSFNILEKYLKNMKKAFNCEVKRLDYKKEANKSKQVLNEWVETSTNEKIKDLFKSIDPRSACILVNCIYFEGKWLNGFKSNSTREGKFYCSNDSISTVSMMSQKASFLYKHDVENNFQCVKLFYKPRNCGMPNKFYMLIILPDDKFGVDEVAKKIDAETIRSLTNKDHLNFSNRYLDLKMPKFELSYDIKLNETFKLLGISDAFDEKAANFSKMSPDPIYVSDAIHKAFIDVDEDGTVAVTVTYCMQRHTCKINNPRKEHPFIVDHPFIFLIQHDHQTLFMGKINSL